MSRSKKVKEDKISKPIDDSLEKVEDIVPLEENQPAEEEPKEKKPVLKPEVGKVFLITKNGCFVKDRHGVNHRLYGAKYKALSIGDEIEY